MKYLREPEKSLLSVHCQLMNANEMVEHNVLPLYIPPFFTGNEKKVHAFTYKANVTVYIIFIFVLSSLFVVFICLG